MSINPEDLPPLFRNVGKHIKGKTITVILSVLVVITAIALINILSSKFNTARATQEVEETVQEAEKIVPVEGSSEFVTPLEEVNVITGEPVDDSAEGGLEGDVKETASISMPLENPSDSTGLTWESNPQNCDLDTQFIAAEYDFYCIDKPVAIPLGETEVVEEPVVNSVKPKIAPAVEEELTPSGKLDKIADNSTPTVECDLETQWISAEEPQYCIDKPVETEPVVEEVVETIAETTETVSVEPTETMEPVKADCDDATQWWSSDYSYCIDKPVATTVAATPVPVVSSGDCGLVYNYSNWNADVAWAVCMAESGNNAGAYNPEAHNGCGGSLGLMQVACLHPCSTFDPVGNIACANQIYSTSGWQPWGAYTNGSYYAYL